MADLIEDQKKKKASFGDAAAAATDGGVTQLNVGKPGDFPVNPDGMPMQKPAPKPGLGAVAPAAPAYVPGSLPKIGQEVPLAPGAQQALSNQTSMYVTGAQAANPQPTAIAPTERPPAFSTSTLAAPSAPAQPQSDYARQMGELGGFLGAIPGKAAKWFVSAPGSDGMLSFDKQPAATPDMSAYVTRMKPDQYGARSATMPAKSDSPLPVMSGASEPAALTSSAVAPISAGAVKTQGQMNMEADLKSAEAMKAERLAAERSNVPRAVVTHSGNDWNARNALRALEIKASSISAKPHEIEAYLAAQKHDISLQGGGTAADIANLSAANRSDEINSTAQVANARTAQQGQQFGASQEIATQRLALDNRKADIADAGAQMDNATKKQIQELNAAILKEPPGPKRDAMLETHQTLTGKYQRPDPAPRELYKAVTDPVTGKVTMYNTQTGEVGAGQPPPPKVGEIKSGHRFKGGDPAEQKNWEKV